MTVTPPSLTTLQPPADSAGTASIVTDEEQLRAAAKKFEAAFIAQMLTHSGFADALTSAGGKGADAFTGFYMEQIASSIADQGGFGLADQIYRQLQRVDSQREETGHDRSVKL